MKRMMLVLMMSSMLAPQRVTGTEISRDTDAVTEEQATAAFQKAGMAPEEARTRAAALDQTERAQLARHGLGPKGGHLDDHDLLIVLLIVLIIAIVL